MDDDEEWIEDDDISPTLSAKVLALKVCRNRSLAHASSDTALEISKPVLKMFATLLEHSGSFAADAADE
jgi:sister-chromatid-cohesion protein PDS5